MLVLSRYRGEKIFIGDQIVITVGEIRGDKVAICIAAPPEIRIMRGELKESPKRNDSDDPKSNS